MKENIENIERKNHSGDSAKMVSMTPANLTEIEESLVDVEYIESGTFQGGEEATSRAGIKHGEECVVLKKAYVATLVEAVKAREKDKRRLDWIEAQSDSSSCIARMSDTGRGFRLHNTGRDDSCNPAARSNFRAAIDAAMEDQERWKIEPLTENERKGE